MVRSFSYSVATSLSGCGRVWDAVSLQDYTHGHDVYHPYVRCVYHLYDRTKAAEEYGQGRISRFAPARRGTDGLTGQERERASLAELFGVSGGDRYGLGTARTLREFERFSGVSFRDQSIRKFAYDGRFDVEHDATDMAFVDWAAERRAAGGSATGRGRHRRIGAVRQRTGN